MYNITFIIKFNLLHLFKPRSRVCFNHFWCFLFFLFNTTARSNSFYFTHCRKRISWTLKLVFFLRHLFWVTVNVAVNLSSKALSYKKCYKSTFDTPTLLIQCQKRDPLIRRWYSRLNITRFKQCFCIYRHYEVQFMFLNCVLVIRNLNSGFMKHCLLCFRLNWSLIK